MGQAKRRQQALAAGQPDDRDCYRLFEGASLVSPADPADPAAMAYAQDLLALAGRPWRDGRTQLLTLEPARRGAALLDWTSDVILAAAGSALGNLIAPPAAPPLQLGCRAGCAWCCQQPVEVSIPEAILAYRALASADDPRLAAARTVASADLARAGRFGLRDCPFLGADRSCTIYAARPLICRFYLGPDGERCASAFRERADNGGAAANARNSYTWPRFLGRAFAAAVSGLAQDCGLQADAVELSAAVALMADDPAAIERWQAGETVFVPLQQGAFEPQ